MSGYPLAEVERLCEVMHDAYEAAAAQEGWETQEQSRKPWSEVPEANKATMRVAVRALLAGVRAEGTTETPDTPRCEGSSHCTAPLHIHGCYADRDGTACDDPTEHYPTPPAAHTEPAETPATGLTDAETVPACIAVGCFPGLRYQPAIFHPGHAQTCPRYVPNVENFCVDCGSMTNYAPHKAWCALAARAKPAPSGDERDLRQRLFVALTEQRVIDSAKYGEAPYAPISPADVDHELARVIDSPAPYDDRLITCPECRSTFEAEDGTVVPAPSGAEAARLHHGQPNETCIDADRRAETAEAALERVRALAEQLEQPLDRLRESARTIGEQHSLDVAERQRSNFARALRAALAPSAGPDTTEGGAS